MENFQSKNAMPKEKRHPIADQFSDDEMNQIKRYGQALGGSPTPFDEEVEKYLKKYEAKKEKIESRPERRIAPAAGRRCSWRLAAGWFNPRVMLGPPQGGRPTIDAGS